MRKVFVTEKDILRFWGKVDKSGGEDACWNWIWGKNEHGYGVFSTAPEHKSILAHRFAWLITNGEIQNGLCVLHRCDNPPCCNPAHLFLGTRRDNVYDMHMKGRARSKVASGENNPFAKLSDLQVAEIRRRFLAGESMRKLARESGVSKTHIGRIVRLEVRLP
jgi:hypothetical protein